MTIRVLIAEDSAYQRKVISEMVSEHNDIEVINTARDGKEAIEMVRSYQPDVLLLDLLMPNVDGLTAFKKIIKDNPLPTIIFSVLDPRTLDASIQALLLGAFDYILKPGGVWKEEFPKFKERLTSKVLLAYKSNKIKINREITPKNKLKLLDKNEAFIKETYQKQDQKLLKTEVDNFIEKPLKKTELIKSNVIVMGSSIGGPKTLKSILKKLPQEFQSSILIVQHLDAFFIKQFAESLDNLCKIKVKVAENGEKIRPGVVYIAPGDQHMAIVLRNNSPCIRIFDGERINFCKPSIDPLFYSAARVFKNHAMGIILTGLGNDGTAGLAEIKKAGGKTIAESSETSVVYGMPKIAAEIGAAQLILPNNEISNKMIVFARRNVN